MSVIVNNIVQKFNKQDQNTRIDRHLIQKMDPINPIINYFTEQNYALCTNSNYEKIYMICSLLNKSRINISLLKDESFNGVPDECRGLRHLVWLLVIGYLPLDPKMWLSFCKQQARIYEEFRVEFLVNPGKKRRESGTVEGDINNRVDHPLCLHEDSSWKQYFGDRAIWEVIDNDVKRTRTEVSFFIGAVDPAQNIHTNTLFEQMGKRTTDLDPKPIDHIETHGDVISRILFIYAKLNPAVGYVQGMNEILAVVYYLFNKDKIAGLEQYLESDSFFCFSILMSELRDNFIRSLDRSDTGLKGTLDQVQETLRILDPEVHQIIEEMNIKYEFFALRWVLLLFSQEFSIPDVFRLWDSLLSDEDRFTFLNFICVAMIETEREVLLDGDFTDSMHAIQHCYKNLEVGHFITNAQLLYQDYTTKKDYVGNREIPDAKEEEEKVDKEDKGTQ